MYKRQNQNNSLSFKKQTNNTNTMQSFPPPPQELPNQDFERPIPEISFQQIEGHVYRSQKRGKINDEFNEDNIDKNNQIQNFENINKSFPPPPPPNENSPDVLDKLKIPSKNDLLVKRDNNSFINKNEKTIPVEIIKQKSKEQKLDESNSKIFYFLTI